MTGGRGEDGVAIGTVAATMPVAAGPGARGAPPSDGAAGSARVDRAVATIAALAPELDRAPRFPREAFEALADSGALAATLGAARERAPVRPAWDLLRRVAAADASVGRILDGHLNAVERLEVAADPELRDRQLAAVAAGESLLGVWGADPRGEEGDPARLRETAAGLVLRGAKTFCSGAGGVDAALVMVGSDDGTAPALVLVECEAEVEVDRDWYRAAGLRASESHLVVFHDVPVTAVLGGPGELGRDPWFSRDAMRTAATWAGMVDAAADAALDALAAAGRRQDPLAQLAAGRILAARGTVDAWLTRAATAADAAVRRGATGPPTDAAVHRGPSGSPTDAAVHPAAVSAPTGGAGHPPPGPPALDPRATSVAMRAEIDRAAKAILGEAAAACGSHPFVTGGALDRARRDLETFLLQHRLDPLLARLGGERLAR